MGMFDGRLGDLAGSLLGGGSGGKGGDMLGGLLGQLGGGHGASGGGNTAMLTAVMAMVQQQGGLEGLAAKFQQGGLGELVQSWVGTGANAAVSPAQLEHVLGAESLASVAQSAGVAPAQASTGLAAMLPELVNQLTPNGQIPANSGEMLSQGMSMLKGMLGK